MAKGQIHMGKNGPEKCSVDSSNPRSRGCPFEATGHYSSADEAMESYATLNRVDPGELKELVTDGASPKDAVGLIRSGYGSDYLAAAKRDEREPEVNRSDYTSSYLEAKTLVEIELRNEFREFREPVSVRAVQSSEWHSSNAVLVGIPASGNQIAFDLIVSREEDDRAAGTALENAHGLVIGKNDPSIRGAWVDSVRVRLEESIAKDGELRKQLKRILDSSQAMFDLERAESAES